MTSTVIMI